MLLVLAIRRHAYVKQISQGKLDLRSKLPNPRNTKDTTLRHIIIKLLKTSFKEKNLKSSLRTRKEKVQNEFRKMQSALYHLLRPLALIQALLPSRIQPVAFPPSRYFSSL